MRFAIISALLVFISFQAQAAERTFQIFSTKQITPQVDRFYGQDGNAFGTAFCKDDSAQVMFVDSRYKDLDGKNFKFASLDECNTARSQAQDFNKKCTATLVLDTTAMTAKVTISNCK